MSNIIPQEQEQAKAPTKEPLLTRPEVAKLFRVSPRTVTRWAASGLLSACFTPGGHRRYRESEVHAFLQTRRSEVIAS